MDTVGRRDSIAAVAAASLDEPQVLGLLAQIQVSDSAVGALGAAKASSSDVKDFGRMILREHHALHRDALELAEHIGAPVEAPRVSPADAPAAQREVVVTGAPGIGWDRVYLQYAVTMHQAALENAARALAATHRDDIREYIRKAVPILEKHLDKARSLQKSLTTSAPTGK